MARRIDAERALDEVNSGRAILACAYDDTDKCEKYHLSGALSLNDLQAQERTLPKDRKLIFYCA